MKSTKTSFTVRKSLLLIIFGLVLLVGLFGFAIKADATEATGWVEVRAAVPEGFTANIIVGFKNSETYQDYAVRVIQANNYIARFQVPAGNYTLAGAFLENGDYRYNTELVSGPSEFTIQGNEKDAALLLEFETTFNAAYAESDPTEELTEAPTVTDPVPDESSVAPEPSEEPTEEIPTEEPTDAVSAEDSATSETDAPDASEDPGDEDEGEKSGLSGWQKLLYGFLSTVAFVGLIFLAAYLYRRHIELN